jgi:hypothetical protein
MSGSSIWASLAYHCCFWIAGGLVHVVPYHVTIQLRLSLEQSGKVEYERERLLGIANNWKNLLAIPSNLSRSYSTFPLCSGDNLNWNSCILTLQLFKNSIYTQEKQRLNLHSLSVSELLEYRRICIRLYRNVWEFSHARRELSTVSI